MLECVLMFLGNLQKWMTVDSVLNRENVIWRIIKIVFRFVCQLKQRTLPFAISKALNLIWKQILENRSGSNLDWNNFIGKSLDVLGWLLNDKLDNNFGRAERNCQEYNGFVHQHHHPHCRQWLQKQLGLRSYNVALNFRHSIHLKLYTKQCNSVSHPSADQQNQQNADRKKTLNINNNLRIIPKISPTWKTRRGCICERLTWKLFESNNWTDNWMKR